MAQVLVIGTDPDHGGIVSEKFLGEGDVDGETILTGYSAALAAKRNVTDHASPEKDHFGRVEIDGAAEALHEVFEDC